MGVNCYDYGARFYDPALARFTTIDPLAETYNFQSPFAYAANNPIKLVDKDGKGPGEPDLHDTMENGMASFAQASLAIFKAMGSVFSFGAEVHENASTSKSIKAGDVTLKTEVKVENKSEVSFNLGNLLGSSPESGLQNPFSFSNSTTVSETKSATVDVDNVQIEGAVSTDSNGDTSKSVTISSGVDTPIISTKAFVKTENKTSSNGTSSSSMSMGVQGDVKVYQDKNSSISIGTSLSWTPIQSN